MMNLKPVSTDPQNVILGVNIDHVATLRQARGGKEPSVLEAACDAILGGAAGITAHLREDRRHIQDQDIICLRKKISVPLNLEMSIEPEIVSIACRVKPQKACLVPERRQELTTEGGLDVVGKKKQITQAVCRLQSVGTLVSLFIDPIPEQICAAAETGCDFIELHTGCYANAAGKKKLHELSRLRKAVQLAYLLGLGVNAGHGLNYENVQPVAKFPHLHELNIGHSIISRAIFVGVFQAVREMKQAIRKARHS